MLVDISKFGQCCWELTLINLGYGLCRFSLA